EPGWTIDGGGLFLNSANGLYVDTIGTPSAQLLMEPHILGLTRELALKRMSWISSLFHYQRPQIGFSRGEQRLLVVALRGGTDEEVSDELAISLSAVKKAWRSVYDRAAEHLPDSILNVDAEEEHRNGDRGKQKKQRLLAYLREHPEELRPYSRKARKESQIAVQR